MDADDGQLIRFQHHQGWACYCNEKRQLVVIFKKAALTSRLFVRIMLKSSNFITGSAYAIVSVYYNYKTRPVFCQVI